MTTDWRTLPQVNRTETKTAKFTARDFGVRDGKGRTIGAGVSLYEVDYAALTAEEIAERRANYGTIWHHTPGHFYGFSPCALRGGSAFGAYSGGREFATAEARDKAAEKYFRDAEKRAAKLAAKEAK
jgi:hypothetical protein